MTVFSLRLSLSSTLWKKLLAYLFDKTVDDYVVIHVTSYLSKHAKHSPLVGH